MIIFFSLGSHFSGGGIVLHQIVSNLTDKGVKTKISQPLIFSKGGRVTRFMIRIIQIIWLLIWPIFTFSSKKKYVITHSLFLCNPFVFFIPKNRIYFLCQGEELNLIQGAIGCILRRIYDLSIKRFLFLSTNEYLYSTIKNKGCDVIRPSVYLGPKDVFYSNESHEIKARKVIVFARSGHNKGLIDALEVADNSDSNIDFTFITPENKIYNNLTSKGYNCVCSIDASVIQSIISKSSLLLLPSFYEGLSLPLLEALAMKVEVITFSKGFPEWFSKTNKHVHFISNRNLKVTVDTIRKLMNNNVSYYEPFISSNKYCFERYCNEVSEILSS
ncbi:glycosyltransferase [Dongshaea marina]|uniref:glycosyltransferase n=1 Tax=Dongshaea marina TaxID=2047966 RepID=UPI000D3E79E4|nr:glycosyltransferase [Dongshaea marina]